MPRCTPWFPTSAGMTPVRLHASGSDPQCSSAGVSIVINANCSANLRIGRLVNSGQRIGGGTRALVGFGNAQDQWIDLSGGATSTAAAAIGGGVDILFSTDYYADGNDAMQGYSRRHRDTR